ncbi:MAG TPA: phosphopentomutase [Actinomycetota bacterium]|nr:phosphopentomutase [Actinomycetota bacterium]
MKVLLLVCDSFGVGEAPDAAAYGDQGSDTIGNTARAVGGIEAPNLADLGLGLLTEAPGIEPRARPGTAHGKMRERSAGKDTTTGHWEVAGLIVERPFPTYPDGFPAEVVEPFERAIGLEVLGNRPASGTEIIEELGKEHLRTGRPIVYTSADSVFQIAAHKDVVPLDRLYEWCRIARGILDGDHRVGRVIARPFVGRPRSFTRTHERRDFSVEPFKPTYLDRMRDGGIPVYGVGKIPDIFAGRGLTESEHSESNDHGVALSIDYLAREDDVLVVTNLVDFDTKYGHRNDAEGYARCVEAFDRRVPDLVDAVGEGLLFLTGDHGCDPTDQSTDHTREHTPVLVAGGALVGRSAVDIGVRDTFADLGATVASVLGVGTGDGLAGTSFAEDLGLG